jgi:deoxyribodipyrimidine photo-lyase
MAVLVQDLSPALADFQRSGPCDRGTRDQARSRGLTLGLTHPRIEVTQAAPLKPDGEWVLYWMTASRRLGWNHALDRAVQTAQELAKPLLILEAVRSGYRWASDRHHRFLLDGMAEHWNALRGTPVGYYPYVERGHHDDRGLLSSLSALACCVVTDDSPVHFTRDLVSAGSRLQGVRVEAVDSCGLLPIWSPGRTFSAAYHFRRYLQRELPRHLGDAPNPDPLADANLVPCPPLPNDIVARWPPASLEELESHTFLASLPIDHSVAAISDRGGTKPATARLHRFLSQSLSRYDDDRNHPDLEASSGLSPWLHFGHLSAHEVFRAVADLQSWSPLRLSEVADGRRSGWWGMTGESEAFLDQLVTWRELGYGYCAMVPDYDHYETLPEWARKTLEAHASDERPWVYELDELENAETHDALWNAAQRQLRSDGIVHNYLRMLWGKKILEWTSSPRKALEVMIHLNNRWAIDGRDPNSYSGIAWCLGRFDRGWPERAVFGKVRSMTSESARRKIRLKRYLEDWRGP